METPISPPLKFVDPGSHRRAGRTATGVGLLLRLPPPVIGLAMNRAPLLETSKSPRRRQRAENSRAGRCGRAGISQRARVAAGIAQHDGAEPAPSGPAVPAALIVATLSVALRDGQAPVKVLSPPSTRCRRATRRCRRYPRSAAAAAIRSTRVDRQGAAAAAEAIGAAGRHDRVTDAERCPTSAFPGGRCR